MKQFELARYLELKQQGFEPQIVTRDGKSVRIICTDANDPTCPVVALINIDNEYEQTACFTIHGVLRDYAQDDFDLFFKHDSIKMYTPILRYDFSDSVSYRACCDVYTTREDAENSELGLASNCIKIAEIDIVEI